MEVADARIGSRQKCAPPWMRLRSRVAVPSCGAPARTKPARSAARPRTAHRRRTVALPARRPRGSGRLHRRDALAPFPRSRRERVGSVRRKTRGDVRHPRHRGVLRVLRMHPTFRPPRPGARPRRPLELHPFRGRQTPLRTPRPPRRRTPREPPLRPNAVSETSSHRRFLYAAIGACALPQIPEGGSAVPCPRACACGFRLKTSAPHAAPD